MSEEAGECPFPGWGQYPFRGVVVLSTESVSVDVVYYAFDRRARRPSWMTAQRLIHICQKIV